jgi:predicted RNA-binding protein with TRAM domain
MYYPLPAEVLMGYEQKSKTGNFSKSIEVGKEYTVNITSIDKKGDGIARIQRFVIFVKNGKVGQNIKIKITSIGTYTEGTRQVNATMV